jgi:hypothetical protein
VMVGAKELPSSAADVVIPARRPWYGEVRVSDSTERIGNLRFGDGDGAACYCAFSTSLECLSFLNRKHRDLAFV